MTDRRATYLAARREIRERLRSRAFLISTAIQLVAVIAVAVAVSVTSGGDDTTEVKVGVIGEKGLIVVGQADGFARELDLRFERTDFGDPRLARRAIEDGEVEAVVGTRTLLLTADVPEEARAVLAQAAADGELRTALQDEGLSSQRTNEIVDASEVRVVTVGTDEQDDGDGIAFISTLLLYIALVFCGYAVAAGVVEEKSTRVVELVINAIKPRALLAGKVLGIGLIGLAQLALLVGAGLGVAVAMGEIDLPSGTAETALLALAYFVLGFALYGCAFAVAGSIVSRQEDSSTTTSPVMLTLVAAYILSVSATSAPTSTLAVVGTLLPPTAPLIVPARAAAGELPLEQLLASVVLMLAGCALLIWLAGRVYERTVLRMGAPVKPGELLRLIRSGRA